MAIDAGTIFASLDLKTDKFSSALGEADGKLNAFEKNLNSQGEKMQSVGKKMTAGLTVPLLGIGTMAIKSSMEFKAGMSNVSALSGATGTDLKKLEDIAREMGAKTKFSATEASEGLQYMALAGWDTEQMMAGLEFSLLLAGAAGMELGQATDILTDTMSMFGMEAEEATRMTDILAYAQANSNTDVIGLGEALKYAGAGANAMGYDLESTTGILGTFADQGLKGSSAGTTLNAMFRDMKDKSKDGAIAIGETNIAIVDSQGNYREMVDILADAEEATKDMTMAEKDQALGAVFGTQAIKGVNMVMEAGTDTVREFEEGIRNSNGASKEMYDTMQDNLQGSFENLKSAIAEAGLSLGETLIPMMEKVVKFIQKWVDKFNELDDGTKETIVKVGLLVAAIGPALIVFGKMATGISSVIKVGGSLIGSFTKIQGAGTLLAGGLKATVGFLFSPAGAILVGVAAVIAGGVLLWKNWDTIKEKAGALKDHISEKWTALKVDTKERWEEIKTDVSEKWENIKTDTSDKMESIKSDMSAKWESIKTGTSEKWESMKTDISTKWENIKTDTAAKMENIKSDIASKWENVKTNTSTKLEEIKTNASAKWEEMKTETSQKWESMKENISAKVSEIKENVKTTISDTVSNWKTNIGDMWENTKTTFAGIAESVAGAFTKVKDAISSGIDKIREWNNQRMEDKSASTSTSSSGSKSRYAQGTNYHTGGSALVGEFGPEIVELPKGSKVHTAQASAGMVGGGTSYGDIHVTISAKDIKEMQDVTDFFSRIEQVATQGVT